MKNKKTILPLLILSASLLVGCGGGSTQSSQASSSASASVNKDATAPVISGNQATVNIESGHDWNALEGVSATDETDGDLTSSITVSSMPELTLANGVFTTSDTGDYEITYSVTDKAGNVGKAYTTLTVTPKVAEKEIYKKFDFTNDLEGWGGYINEAVTGTQGLVKDKYVFDITNGDGTDWHVKFSNNYTFLAADYSVKFVLTSTVAGAVRIGIKDSWVNVDVVVGRNEVSHSATIETAGEAGIELQLGLLGTAKVEIESVSITSKVGTDTYTSVLDSLDYSKDTVAYATADGGSEATVTRTATSITQSITKPGDSNGCWQDRIFVKTGYDLVANTKYRISADFLSTSGYKSFEVQINSTDPATGNYVEKGVDCLYGQTSNANETKTISWTGTPTANKDGLQLMFQIGQLEDSTGVLASNSVTISNVKVETVTGNKVETTTEKQFAPSDFYSYNNPDQGLSGSLYANADNELVYEMDKIGATDWWNKIGVKKINLKADKLYTVSFEAKATKAISAACFLNRFGAWDYRASMTANITTEYQKFEYSTTAALADDLDFEVLWQFGSEAAAALISDTISFRTIAIYSQDVSI